MTTILRPAALAALVLGISATTAPAGPIESACLRSGRDAANRQTCACIQQAADMTLRAADQRRAASFFKDPEKAQKVKMSNSAADDIFWERYTNFGEAAEAFCAY